MSEDRNKHDQARGKNKDATGLKVGHKNREDGKGRESNDSPDANIGRPPRGFIEKIFGG